MDQLRKCGNMSIPNGVKNVNIEGITTIDEFITEEEEMKIVEELD